MHVAIFVWELGAPLFSASAFLRFKMVVAKVSASVLVSSYAFVSSSTSLVIGSTSSMIVKLVDLRLKISDGVHECLHLCHHGLVLV